MRYGDKPVVQTNQTYTFVDYMLPYGQPNGPSFGPMYLGAFLLRGGHAGVDQATGPDPSSSIAVGDPCSPRTRPRASWPIRPVLCTTVAPPADLVTVIADEDRLICTLGIASGARPRLGPRLEARRPHATAQGGGAATVSQVGRGPKEAAYNLVVADFNTYFVGKEKLLVHDVTLPGPTAAEVPGQKTP